MSKFEELKTRAEKLVQDMVKKNLIANDPEAIKMQMEEVLLWDDYAAASMESIIAAQPNIVENDEQVLSLVKAKNPFFGKRYVKFLYWVLLQLAKPIKAIMQHILKILRVDPEKSFDNLVKEIEQCLDQTTTKSYMKEEGWNDDGLTFKEPPSVKQVKQVLWNKNHTKPAEVEQPITPDMIVEITDAEHNKLVVEAMFSDLEGKLEGKKEILAGITPSSDEVLAERNKKFSTAGFKPTDHKTVKSLIKKDKAAKAKTKPKSKAKPKKKVAKQTKPTRKKA